MHLMIKY